MIRLEPLRMEHADLIADAARESVAEVNPWMPWCVPEFTTADAATWIGAQAETRATGMAYEFAIVEEDGTFLGGAGINQVNPEHRLANLGYWVRSSRTGQGVATEALRQLVAWARKNTDLNRLEVIVAVDNRPSQRVAEKAGATKEALARSRLYLHGRFYDACIYTFLR